MAKKARSQESADKQNSEAKQFYQKYWKQISDYVKNTDIIHETNILRSDDRLNDYQEISLSTLYPYYVHKNILFFLLQSNLPVRTFLQALLYAGTLEDKSLSRFVFTQCKYRVKRKKDNNSVDRFDVFCCTLATDTLVYRHQGTVEGCVLFGQMSNNTIKELNHIMLRVLQHGPGKKSELLICSITGKLVEGKVYYDPETMEDRVMNCFEIHHSTHAPGGSLYFDIVEKKLVKKLISPSKHMHAYRHTEFTLQIWIELLSCVIVDIGEHETLHKMVNTGHIDHWITGYKLGKYSSIPYAWRSKTHYNEIIEWICNECNFMKTDFPTYDQFLMMYQGKCHDWPGAAQDVDSEDSSKIRPNVQNPIPCKLAVAIPQNSARSEKLPISLFCLS